MVTLGLPVKLRSQDSFTAGAAADDDDVVEVVIGAAAAAQAANATSAITNSARVVNIFVYFRML